MRRVHTKDMPSRTCDMQRAPQIEGEVQKHTERKREDRQREGENTRGKTMANTMGNAKETLISNGNQTTWRDSPLIKR